MPMFRKIPVEVEAIQFTEENADALVEFGAGAILHMRAADQLRVRTSTDNGRQGVAYAVVGDWIVKGVKGEFYPCRDDVFKLTYEAIGDKLGIERRTVETHRDKLFEKFGVNKRQALLKKAGELGML